MTAIEFLDFIKIPYEIFSNDEDDVVAYIVQSEEKHQKQEDENNPTDEVFIPKNASPDVVVRILLNAMFYNGLYDGYYKTTNVLKDFINSEDYKNPNNLFCLATNLEDPYKIKK
jgi:hypothetical protein